MLNIPMTRVASLALPLLVMVVGCGNRSCSTEAGYVQGTVTSCSGSLAPGTQATILLGGLPCGCGETPSCAVVVSQTGIQLTPSVEICPVVGPSAPCACLPASCTFTTPGAGTYTVTFPTGAGTTSQATVVVASGGAIECSLGQ